MKKIKIALEYIEKYCDTGLYEELDKAICELQNESYECRKRYVQGNLPGVVEDASEEEYGKDVKRMIITSKKFGKREVLIDAEDWNRVKEHKWFLHQPKDKIYVATGAEHRYLHRLIMNTPSGMVTDHINGNTLDNRKVNLRVCTVAQNARNRNKNKNNVSGYIGVSFRPKAKGRNRWEARCGVKGPEDKRSKNHYLGLYETAEEAARARDRFLRELRGDCEFTRYNFPEEK